MQKMPSTRSAGFTMLEIIVVLVIIGVLSAVVSGVMSSTDFAREAGEAEQFRMDLRFAQQRALASTEDVKFRSNADGDWYQITNSMEFATGEQRIYLQSDLKTSPNVIFSAQTGLPDRDCVYEIGESQIVHVNGTTGLIE